MSLDKSDIDIPSMYSSFDKLQQEQPAATSFIKKKTCNNDSSSVFNEDERSCISTYSQSASLIKTEQQVLDIRSNSRKHNKIHTKENESIFIKGIENPDLIGDIREVLKVIKNDLKGADLKFSLYIAACNSYRYHFCLYPYPSGFMHDVNQFYERLVFLNGMIPPLQEISILLEKSYSRKQNFVINLLHWLLVDLREPSLITVPKHKHDTILSCVSNNISVGKPSAIFQLMYNTDSPSEEKWKRVKGEFKTKFAFHGSRLDNFHSILHYGLCHHLNNKDTLFGPGIYLSSELSISLFYSPSGLSWKNSIIGSEISVIALVEFVDHPSVKCQKSGVGTPQITYRQNDVPPKKYYIVPNADLVRVRYLLVYVTRPPSLNVKSPSLFDWVRRNKLIVLLLLYILFLMLIGFNSNPNMRNFLRSTYRRVKFLVDNFKVKLT